MQNSSRTRALIGSVSAMALMTGLGAGFQASAQTEDRLELETVTVTVRKREESLQDVPASVQAFDEAAIERLNVTGFEDYARFAPSISFNSEGPGRTKLVIRGVAESTGTRTGQSSAGIYLDEQPLTSNAQTPDIRIVDVERIEVLNGPQGTLYGASSQSGTLKIITNKPDTTGFEGYGEGTAKSLDGGDASYDLNGMVNLPVVKDKIALRLVGFYGEEGGYVDNVLGTTPGGTVTNAGLAKDNFDGRKSYGGRASVRADLNDRWTVTAGAAFQTADIDGLSDYDPAVGDLKVVKFFDEHYKDEWDQVSLTVDGDLGFADLVVASSYFRRDIDSIADNTAYMQFLTGLAAADPAYYSFYDFGPDPVGFYDFKLKERRTAHEVRLSSKDDSRWGWIVGAFYEKIDADTVAGANIVDYPLTPSYAEVAAYLAEPTDIYFFQRVAYDQDQKAVFGEVSYRFTDQLTGTLGGRYFDANNNGSIVTDIPEGLNIENSVLKAPENGFTPKVSLAWQANEDLLVYGTFSQGFRLGGANRDRPGILVPLQYDADKLSNYELGLKSEWADGRIVFNAAAFYMTWDDFQLEVKNPDPSTFFFVTANVGQAEIKGAEAELNALVSDHLHVGLSGSILDASLSESSDFLNASAGTRLPVTPELKFAAFGEYRVPMPSLGGEGYIRADYSHTGDSLNSVDPDAAQILKSYDLVNLQIGLDKDDWTLNLFLNNAFDKRGVLYISPASYKNSRNVTRPREFGITVSRTF
jgi:iron complex outermembrane receptor protein